jgi:predicted N-acetyltransferase YhbS
VQVVGYSIQPAHGLAAVGDLYDEVGFRADLVDDLDLVCRIGGDVFVAIADGEVLGASSCLPFGETGWVGGVAVRPDRTRQGVGRALTERAAATLAANGVRTTLLYATEVARPLYTRMGFEKEARFVELVGPPVTDAATDPQPQPQPRPQPKPGQPDDLPDVLALDRRATGEDRRYLIADLWPQGGSVVRQHGQLVGYALRQSPSSVGAVVADTDAAADALIHASLAAADEPQRVGVAAEQHDLIERLRKIGYTEHLGVTRMHRGDPPAATAARRTAFNLYWG